MQFIYGFVTGVVVAAVALVVSHGSLSAKLSQEALDIRIAVNSLKSHVTAEVNKVKSKV